MKINSILLKGFKSRNRVVEFNFSESNITVIYGDNGCGKTTFLKILHGIFSVDEKILISNNVAEIHIKYIDNEGKNDFVAITENKSEKKIDLNSYNFYDWTDFLKSGLSNIYSVFIGVERGFVSNTPISTNIIIDFFMMNSISKKFMNPNTSYRAIKELSEHLSEYISYYNNKKNRRTSGNVFEGKNIYLKEKNIDVDMIEDILKYEYNSICNNIQKQIQNALFDTSSLIFENRFNEYDSNSNLNYVRCELTDEIMEIISAEQSNIDDNNILKLIKCSTFNELIDRCTENKFIALLVKNIIINVKQNEQNINYVNVLEKKFNSFLIKGKTIKIDRTGIWIEHENEKHRLSDLSSGEIQLLTLLTCLLIDSSKRDIIMIDEPEISLNVNWQRELINIINECVPNTQVVLATHSPSVPDGHSEYLKELE